MPKLSLLSFYLLLFAMTFILGVGLHQLVRTMP